jgi:hypothetical protein
MLSRMVFKMQVVFLWGSNIILYVAHTNFSQKPCLSRTFSHRSVGAEVGVRFQAIPCDICREKRGTGTDFSPQVIGAYPLRHSTDAPYLST